MESCTCLRVTFRFFFLEHDVVRVTVEYGLFYIGM